MLYLKQSTASQSVLLGPFVDDTDGATAETGLTIANTDIKLSKNGGTIANKNSGGGTHDANGWYAITLDATDTNTVGRLQISCKVAGALAVWMECQVLEEAIYDALFAASAAGFDSNQRVNVGLWLGTAPAALTDTDKIQVSLQHGATGVITSTLIAADAIGASELAADAVTEIRDAITGGAYSLDTDANGRVRVVDGTGAGEIALTSGLIDGITGTKTNFDALNDISSANVNSEVDTALADIGLDHLLSASVSGLDVTDDSIFAKLVSSSGIADWDDFSNDTDSLQAIRDRGDAAWITATGFSTHSAANVADAVWDEAQADHVSVGSFGEIATEIASILADTNELQTDDVPGLIAALNDLSQAEVTGGAYALDTDANGRIRIVDGTGAGELDTDLGTVLLRAATEAQIDAIEADTNELQTDWVNGGRLDLLLDAVLADTNELQTDDVPGLIAALNDISVSSILTTQMTESYAANGVAPTLAESLFAIHQMLMQFAISGTSVTVKKLDNSTTAFVGTLDNATTPTSLVRT